MADRELRRPLLQTGAEMRHAQDEAHIRGEGLGRLMGTTERLRDALRLQAQMAQALRQREEEKAKTSWWKMGKKRKKKKKDKKKPSQPVIVEVASEDLLGSSVGEAADWESNDSTSDDEHHGSPKDPRMASTSLQHEEHTDDVIRRVYEGDIQTPEEVVREAVDRQLDLDELLESMFQRAETIQRQTNVAFERTEAIVQSHHAKRRRIYITMGVTVGLAIIVALIVVLVLKPWQT